MKKLVLYAVLLFSFVFSSCDKLIDLEPQSSYYYLSVRIVDLTTGVAIPLSDCWIGGTVGPLSLTGKTDSNGWFTQSASITESTFINMKITSKDFSKAVNVEAFSPANRPEMFVRKEKDYKTNIPSNGYHLWTRGMQ